LQIHLSLLELRSLSIFPAKEAINDRTGDSTGRGAEGRWGMTAGG